MDNDDEPVGRILSRREVLSLIGATGAALLVGSASYIAQSAAAQGTGEAITYLPLVLTGGDGATATPTATATSIATAEPTATATTASTTMPTTIVPSCVVRPEVTEGPYYLDNQLNRADVRVDTTTGATSEGALLSLTFNVSEVGANGCVALPNAVVEIWHCDAYGDYSGVSGDTGDFLRGYVLTDANGGANFTTVYPGWYRGRAVHIHFKIRTSVTDNSGEFTSQLFFDDDFTDQVYTAEPYASQGQRDRLNSNDTIYDPLLTLDTTTTAQGYAATFAIGVDLS